MAENETGVLRSGTNFRPGGENADASPEQQQPTAPPASQQQQPAAAAPQPQPVASSGEPPSSSGGNGEAGNGDAIATTANSQVGTWQPPTPNQSVYYDFGQRHQQPAHIFGQPTSLYNPLLLYRSSLPYDQPPLPSLTNSIVQPSRFSQFSFAHSAAPLVQSMTNPTSESEISSLREEIQRLRAQISEQAQVPPVQSQSQATASAQTQPSTASETTPTTVSSQVTSSIAVTSAVPSITSGTAHTQAPTANPLPLPDPFYMQPQWQYFPQPSQAIANWAPYRSRRPPPPFNKSCVDAWFRLLDIWFEDEGQQNNQSFKFRTAISLMDCQLLQNEFFEFLQNPPAENAYNALRTAMVKHFAVSETERFSELVSGIQLGDSRPSHLLAKLRKVANGCPEPLLRNFWLQRLPETNQSLIRMFAETNKSLTLSQLAEVADTSMNQGTGINAVAAEPPFVAELRKSIEALSKELKQLRSRSISPSGSEPRQRSRSRSNAYCHYHRRFKEDARNCEPSCKNWESFMKDHPDYKPKTPKND